MLFPFFLLREQTLQLMLVCVFASVICLVVLCKQLSSDQYGFEWSCSHCLFVCCVRWMLSEITLAVGLQVTWCAWLLSADLVYQCSVAEMHIP